MPGGKSGNGWVTCELGHQHWGLFGAAGVLVYVAHPADQALSLVLLQHRARWVHQGGTWALPGGAMDSDETPAEAVLREALVPLTVRTAEIRIVAVADGAQASDVLADLAANTPGRTAVTDLGWLLGGPPRPR